MKTIERSHQPNKLWERVKLPRNYEKALETIDKHLEYWPKLLLHKIKQRLTKMTQYRIRMRKLELKVREKIMTVPRKEKKREARREEKAEKAALLEKSIEAELLERLTRGNVYPDDIFNSEWKNFIKILRDLEPDTKVKEEDSEDEETQIEYVEGNYELEEEDMEDFRVDESLNDAEYGDIDGDNEEAGTSDLPLKRKPKVFGPNSGKSKRKPRVLIEVENDDGGERQKAFL